MSCECELYDRECINCGECDICDLDTEKHCDDCGRCIEDIDEYRSLNIEDFVKQNVTEEQIGRMEKKLIELQKEKENRLQAKTERISDDK